MSTYQADARREGKFWLVEVEGVGATQGRTLVEAREMAADLVASLLDVPLSEVDVDFHAQLPDGVGEQVNEARRLQEEATELARMSADRLRTSVERLRRSGLTGSDVATILGVSPQRVSQLSSRPPSHRPPSRSHGSSDSLPSSPPPLPYVPSEERILIVRDNPILTYGPAENGGPDDGDFGVGQKMVLQFSGHQLARLRNDPSTAPWLETHVLLQPDKARELATEMLRALDRIDEINHGINPAPSAVELLESADERHVALYPGGA